MARVTRRQAAAAGQSSDVGKDDAKTPTTTGAIKPADTKKRPIAGSKAAGANIVGLTDDDPTDQAAGSQAKKRKTANATKATKVNKVTKANKATKDTAGKDVISEDKAKGEENNPAAPDPITTEKVGKVPLAEGGIANSKDLVIPMDSVAARDGRLTANFTVYIDPSGMIYDASLNQTNATNNNNKFYMAQVLGNKATSKYYCWTRWGRVGESGQSALLGQGTLGDAVKNFEKKFKDKSGLRWADRAATPKLGKYAYVEKSYDPDSDGSDDEEPAKKETDDVSTVATPTECTLDKPVRELVELIFNQSFFNNTMMSFNYDANKLPLGKLGRTTITRGFQALKDLSAVLNDPGVATRDHGVSPMAAVEHFSNQYYSVIPHAFGRNRPPVINSQDVLKREVEMLESLSDMKAAADILKEADSSGLHPLDRQFQGLNLEEITPLSPTSKEYKTLTAYLHGSKGSTHSFEYNVIDVFRITRPFEKERFENSPHAKIKSDKRLLWHGSRCTNFGGILSQGLRIAPPEAPATGYMFGKGIYLADVSSKSAGYTCSYSSDGNALLLLCEAELGDPMQELGDARYNAGETAKKDGKISTLGLGATGPQKWVDASVAHPSLKGIKMPDPKLAPGPTKTQDTSLYYNEYIAYDVAQVQLRYLFRVKM